MATYRVRRDKLTLPDSSAPVHPDTYVRLIEHDSEVVLENASLEDVPVEQSFIGHTIRRTMILKDFKTDPQDERYVICEVEEIQVPVES